MTTTDTPYYIIRDALCRAEIIAGATQLTGQIAVPLAKARAALAELEKAAAEPVAWMWNDELGIPHASAGSKKPVWLESSASAEYIKQANLRPLYTAPPAPAAEIREVVVTDELAARVFSHWADAPFRTNSQDDDITMPMLGRVLIAAVRAELGPALGLVELKEPTPEESQSRNGGGYQCSATLRSATRASSDAVEGAGSDGALPS